MESASLVPSSLAAPATHSTGLAPSLTNSSLWPGSKAPTITTLASLYRTGTAPTFVSVTPTPTDDQWVHNTKTSVSPESADTVKDDLEQRVEDGIAAKKSAKTGLIAVCSVVGILFVGTVGAGAFFARRNFKDTRSASQRESSSSRSRSWVPTLPWVGSPRPRSDEWRGTTSDGARGRDSMQLPAYSPYRS